LKILFFDLTKEGGFKLKEKAYKLFHKIIAVCPHGVATVAACQACWNDSHRDIINCTHKWFTISDPGMVGVYCDFSNIPRHTVATVAKAVVYSCHLCHATACSGCVVP